MVNGELLDLRLGVFHSFWKIPNYYHFKYFFCPILPFPTLSLSFLSLSLLFWNSRYKNISLLDAGLQFLDELFCALPQPLFPLSVQVMPIDLF